MRLSDLSIKPSYTKTDDDIAEEFYLPCMRCSNRYDRISGYFGSTIYIIAWDALKEFIESGGHMRLICSPYISDEDERAMSRGYSARHDVLLADSLRAEMDNLFSQAALSAPATLLAYMIAEDIIDIRIAAIDSGMLTADVRRMFHDKVGIFKDTFNNAVGFRGSMNETYKGLSSDGNIESIDAFPSWLGERDAQRLTDAATLFNRLWENSVPNISVYKFPDAVRSILKEKAKPSTHNFDCEKVWNDNGGSDPGSVIECGNTSSNDSFMKLCKERGISHPARFPEKLVEFFVLSGTNAGDIVLDPFSGSGTVAVVAAANGRRWVGIDMNENFCELATERMRVELKEETK